MTSPKCELYLTLPELCALTGFSSATIHRWKRAGRIPYVQPGGKGGHLRFPVEAVEQCLRAGQSQVNTAPVESHDLQRLPGRQPSWRRS